LRGAYARLHGEQARAAALQTIEGQKNQIELLQKQIELTGQGESQRAIIIAQLQAEQQLRQKGIDLASAEGQAILANAAYIERLNQELARSNGAMQALQGITDTTFNHFATLIAQGKTDWKSWADAGRAALADIEKEILKLAVMNPFKNFLFGTNLPTLSNVGGLFSNVFGGFFGGTGQGLVRLPQQRASSVRRSIMPGRLPETQRPPVSFPATCSGQRRVSMMARFSSRTRSPPSCNAGSACSRARRRAAMRIAPPPVSQWSMW
jgi:hypothetical protein